MTARDLADKIYGTKDLKDISEFNISLDSAVNMMETYAGKVKNLPIPTVSGLLRELIMRGNYCPPLTEQDVIWFEEGTDHKKCKDFMLKIFEFVGEQ